MSDKKDPTASLDGFDSLMDGKDRDFRLESDGHLGDTAPTGNPLDGWFDYFDRDLGKMRRRLGDGSVMDIPIPTEELAEELDVCSKCGWSGTAEDEAGCQTWSRSLGLDPNNKNKRICSHCR